MSRQRRRQGLAIAVGLTVTVALATIVPTLSAWQLERKSPSPGAASATIEPKQLTLRPAGLRPRIVNGVLATGLYPEVGMLWRPDVGSICTGTLIGCNTFLTAAHCIDGGFDPDEAVVFFQHYGFVGITSGVENPDFIDFDQGDDAILHLDSTVTGIAPFLINTVAEPANGTPIDLAGFGSIGGSPDPVTRAGILRRGSAVTASCVSVPNDAFTCFSFTHPLGAPGTDSSTCFGDSGGPMFANVPGLGVAVAGVASGVDVANCLPPAVPFHADVNFDKTWIVAEADGDLAPQQCSSLPTVFGPDVEQAVDDKTLLSTTGGVLYTIDVAAGLSELRITTNGEIFPAQDYDLYVSIGSAPTLENLECFSVNGGVSLEACVFASPEAGEYYVLVDNSSGSSGQYQITVTAFGASVPTCQPLDPDGDSSVQPQTDGLLVMGHLFGFSGAALTEGALGEGATRDADEIVDFLESCGSVLDIDANAELEPLADGLLFLRYLLDFRDDALIGGALGAECGLCLADDIEEYIESLLP